jgi:hypothetical protein
MPRASDIRAGGAFVELLLRDEKYLRGLLRAQAKLMRFSAAVTKAGKQMMAMGAGMVAPILAAAKSFAKMGDTLDKMSARVGASVEFLSALGHAAQIGGSDINAFEVSLRRLQRNAYDFTRGLSTSVDAFDELGVSVLANGGKLKTTEVLFMDTVTALSRMEDETKKAALALVLFGRSGTALLPMLKQGKAGLLATMEEARRLGIVLSTEDATAAAEFTDTMTRLWSVIKRVVFNVGAAAADVLEKYAEKLTVISQRAGEWIKEHGDLIVTTLKWGTALLAAGAALTLVGKVAAVAAVAVKGLAFAIPLASSALAMFLAHPIIGIGVVLGLVAAFNRLRGEVTQYSTAMQDALAKGDQARTTETQQLRRLEDLAAKQRLTNDQMDNAAQIIVALESKYGDLGLELDRTTGKLMGVAEAQDKVTAAFRQAAEEELSAAIIEAGQNIEHLEEKIKDLGTSWLERIPGFAPRKQLRGLGHMLGLTDMDQTAKDLLAQHEAESKRQRALLIRRGALRKRGEGTAVTGEAPEGGAFVDVDAEEDKTDRIKEYNERAHRDLTRLIIESMEDEHQRRLYLITEQYRHEKEQARKLGADVSLVETNRRRAIANEEEAHKRRLADEQQRLDEERADRQTQLQHDIERLEIEASKKGLAKRLALIDLEEKRAIAAATETGLAVENIRHKYDLQRQLARSAVDTPKDIRTSARGTFNPWAARGLATGGRPEERTAKAVEDMKTKMGRHIEISQNLLREFQRGWVVT